MPTIAQQAGDLVWVVALASGTTYTGKQAALVAATTLSAANTNASVQIAEVVETATAPVFPSQLAKVDMPGAGVPLYVVQLASGTTYYPQATALVQAYALSASNSNAPVYVAKVVETLTAP